MESAGGEQRGEGLNGTQTFKGDGSICSLDYMIVSWVYENVKTYQNCHICSYCMTISTKLCKTKMNQGNSCEVVQLQLTSSKYLAELGLNSNHKQPPSFSPSLLRTYKNHWGILSKPDFIKFCFNV